MYYCDNTVGHGLEHLGIASLEGELTLAPTKLKRHQAFRDTIGGLHLVSLDGFWYLKNNWFMTVVYGYCTFYVD